MGEYMHDFTVKTIRKRSDITEISRLREAMHAAVLKIEDGAASHARGVLVAALAESEDGEQEVCDE
jgi:hypothetical protein